MKKKMRIQNQSSINLNVLNITQTQKYWCGPAVAESVLRYFGINSASPLLSEQDSPAMQSSLAQRMSTNFFSGTNPDHWINIVNKLFYNHNISNKYCLFLLIILVII